MRVVHDTKGYFSESLQANTGILLKLDCYDFPLNSLKLIIYKPPYDFGFIVWVSNSTVKFTVKKMFPLAYVSPY